MGEMAEFEINQHSKKVKFRLHFTEYGFPQRRSVLRWRYVSGGKWRKWADAPKRLSKAWRFGDLVFGIYRDTVGNEVADIEI